MKKFDLVVIGSGPAGEKAAVKAAYFGHKVALIEKESQLGGAGVITGTLPSKTLKETALYYSGKYDKGLYGIDRELKRQATIENFLYREKLVSGSMEKDVQDNLQNHSVELITGTAIFEDAHTLRILGSKEQRVKAHYILIATGSKPFHPEDIPFDYDRIHDSDSILKLKRFPKSMCIIGAGVIGCEYATIFGAMGIEVFLVNDKSEILSFIDRDICEELLVQMKRVGVDVMMNTKIDKITLPPQKTEMIDIFLNTGEVLHIDMILFAAGRQGCSQGLNLEGVGIKTGKRGTVIVNDKYQTSVGNIYAVGDVIGFPALASTSMDQGRVAVSHIFKLKDLDRLPKIIPYGIYTIPEVSMVGINEQEAIAKKLNYCTGTAKYKNMPRGKIKGFKEGSLKLVFDKDSLVILGVHVIGASAAELVHYGMALVENKKTLPQVLSTVFNYPTLHDLYKYASYDGLGNLAGHKIKDF